MIIGVQGSLSAALSKASQISVVAVSPEASMPWKCAPLDQSCVSRIDDVSTQVRVVRLLCLVTNVDPHKLVTIHENDNGHSKKNSRKEISIPQQQTFLFLRSQPFY